MNRPQPLVSDCFGQAITYCIVLSLTEEKVICIGKKGQHNFPAGYYAYVGSAKRNASSRMNRHWLGSGKKKWHIDYLRTEAIPHSIWGYRQNEIEECQLAEVLQNASFQNIPGFGSSDCRCRSHLFFSTESQALDEILISLEGLILSQTYEFE